MVKIGLSLGSNISPRKKYIIEAIKSLQNFFCYLIFSNLYQTFSYEDDKQQDYYNLVVIVTSKKQASEILQITQSIEQSLGRNIKREKAQPRTIDIDILFYGDRFIKTKNLIIPHYDLWNRDFFLKPLLDFEQQELPNNLNKRILHQAMQEIPLAKRTHPKRIPIKI